MKRVVTGFVLLGCLLAAGCSDHDGLDRAPITGVLTIQGQPLPNASVQFIPAGGGTHGMGALGVSDASGKFTVISSRQSDAGIPPGDYNVMVSRWAEPDGTPLPPDALQADHLDAKETIPAPYSGPGSPLKVTINKEGGEIKIDVPGKLLAPKKGRG